MNMKSIAKMAVLLFVLLSGCGVSSSVSYYDHPAQLIRAELDGTYVIRACGKDRNAQKAMEQAQKTAVYEVIFNGVASSSSTVTSLKPLLLEVNAKERYQDYFNAFFADGGEYRKYYTVEDKRIASSNFKRNHQQVQCLTNVTVDVAALKAKLKEDNILKQ